MNRGICQRYLETSIYTYVGVYKDFIRSLPDDIPSIGRLVCDQITHPSMYFTCLLYTSDAADEMRTV